MRICILGAGSLGSTIGGALALAGNEVFLVGRKAHMDAVNENGLSLVTPDGERTARVQGRVDAAGIGEVDLVIVLCKSFDTEKTVRDNLELVGDGTVVMSLQNGLGAEDTLCDIVGAHRVIGGKTYIGGMLLEPGRVQATIPGKDTFIGELDGSVTERAERIGAAFEDAGMRCIVSDNILGVIWDKLLVNVATGAVCGITGLPYGDMYQEEKLVATAVAAVEEGRVIYQNIRRFIRFLLTSNLGEVLGMLFGMLLHLPVTLLPIQILLVNLFTDGLPAIALGMEAVEKDVMEHKPRPRSEGLFAKGYGLQIALQGLMFGALTLIAYWIGEHQGGSEQAGQTMAFLVLALSQVVQAFNMRSTHSLFKIGPFTNHKLNWAALASFALVMLVAFVPPVRMAFELVVLPAGLYLWALALILFPIVAMEAAKALDFIKHRH